MSTRLNPSDHGTKDTGNIDMLMSRWIYGPEFLKRPESSWPEQPDINTITLSQTEIKKEFTGAILEKTVYEIPKIENFSNWICLLRSMALILLSPKIWKGIAKPEISAEWLEKSEIYLIRKVQEECFGDEIRSINQKQPLRNNSRIKDLTPIITKEDGILRVDEGINATNQVTEAVKKPIILDRKHHLTLLLIKHYHKLFLQGSNKTVVNEVKQKFLVLKLRPTVRTIASQCFLGRLLRGKTEQPRMGDLPPARLEHHKRPFTYCGVDYFGPMLVTIGRRHEKRWEAIFTCMTTRAIHLELTSSLSTDSAIMALQRMSNRRGTPSEIFSDNGTNFIGMNNELRE